MNIVFRALDTTAYYIAYSYKLFVEEDDNSGHFAIKYYDSKGSKILKKDEHIFENIEIFYVYMKLINDWNIKYIQVPSSTYVLFYTKDEALNALRGLCYFIDWMKKTLMYTI